MCRVAGGSYPPPAPTEPDLWASHPALRDIGIGELNRLNRCHVRFPDVRIEYDIDGRDHTLDVEVFTPHYRGAHSAAKANAGFACYRGGGSRLSVRGGVSGGPRAGGRDGRGLAEELFR